MNACHKDFASAKARFCLAFPDVYEVGISHLGIKILYTILNSLSFAMADRCYLHWLDALQLCREENMPLWGLESKKPLREFDVVGITLQTELTYTNVLELLSAAEISLHASDRSDSEPVVLAGGPCAANPLPLVPFFDAFLIGEGEEAIAEIAEVIKLYSPRNSSGFKRMDLLKKLSEIKGVYVPAVRDELIKTDPNLKIEIRKYDDFTLNQKTHKPQLLPWQLATHNRYVAEIMRGCTRGCRFCHAGYFYRPVRERNPEDILDDLLAETKKCGWEEAGLISLSSSDYTCIKPLLEALVRRLDQNKTHISLPSLRADTLDEQLISLLKEAGREGLTIAPEAGTQRLRNVINKNITEAEILQGVEIARKLGWQRIKLYFMLGLPTETEADVQGIITLAKRLSEEAGKNFQISVTLSPFVPKAHTPFQWCAMLPADELLRRVLEIKHALQRDKHIRVHYHTIESSVLEAVLSRGDIHTADWLENAWLLGAHFDGWKEGFDWQIWEEAAKKTGYDYREILAERRLDQALPWDFIDCGISKDWLKQEWERAKHEIVSPDCRSGCTGCGICHDQTIMRNAKTKLTADLENEKIKSLSTLECSSKKDSQTKIQTYRLTYEKGGDFRFIGHLDWMRMIFRQVGCTNLPIVYTQGFNPHPKMSFCPALAVGVTGLAEYFDFQLNKELNINEVEEAFRKAFQDILPFTQVKILTAKEKNALPLADKWSVRLPDSEIYILSNTISSFQTREEFPLIIEKKGITKEYDLKRIVHSILLSDNRIELVKAIQSPNIYALLAALSGKSKEDLFAWDIRRSGFLFSQ